MSQKLYVCHDLDLEVAADVHALDATWSVFRLGSDSERFRRSRVLVAQAAAGHSALESGREPGPTAAERLPVLEARAEALSVGLVKPVVTTRPIAAAALTKTPPPTCPRSSALPLT